MPQTSLAEYVEALDKARLLTRYTDEKRVDELPRLMEDNPDTATLIEHVRDCKLPFFANGYGVRLMYALSLDCDETKVGLEIARRSELRFKPEMVTRRRARRSSSRATTSTSRCSRCSTTTRRTARPI